MVRTSSSLATLAGQQLQIDMQIYAANKKPNRPTDPKHTQIQTMTQKQSDQIMQSTFGHATAAAAAAIAATVTVAVATGVVDAVAARVATVVAASRICAVAHMLVASQCQAMINLLAALHTWPHCK